mmetsp:Transcript_19332/g.51459  ORF Transcript_19332/g.51459 Transcript_19332/m.51459 type:complete len:281 (+) Transcript_19332:119-961(+)
MSGNRRLAAALLALAPVGSLHVVRRLAHHLLRRSWLGDRACPRGQAIVQHGHRLRQNEGGERVDHQKAVAPQDAAPGNDNLGIAGSHPATAGRRDDVAIVGDKDQDGHRQNIERGGATDAVHEPKGTRPDTRCDGHGKAMGDGQGHSEDVVSGSHEDEAQDPCTFATRSLLHSELEYGEVPQGDRPSNAVFRLVTDARGHEANHKHNKGEARAYLELLDMPLEESALFIARWFRGWIRPILHSLDTSSLNASPNCGKSKHKNADPASCSHMHHVVHSPEV